MSTTAAGGRGADVSEITDVAARLRDAIGTVIEGQPDAIDLTLTALFAEGHVLIEDVPGVGKTMLAKALGRAVDANVNRIQFTPDLLPADITGVSIYNQATRKFEFSPGGVFAHIVVGDEINRASPKTQAALLEAMEERQVSIDGLTHRLERPFLVVATQNPIEMEGTYPLPEAQRDRFMMKLSLGYPSAAAEAAMLDNHGEHDPLDDLRPVTDAATVARLCDAVREVHVSQALRDWIVTVVGETRTDSSLRLGASPRASLALLRAARARAALDGRGYVIPDDIRDLAVPVLAHRVLPSSSAQAAGITGEQAVARIIERQRVPGER